MTDTMMALRKFVAPEFVFGAGSRKLVARYAKLYGAHRALLVTDPGLIAAGWAGERAGDGGQRRAQVVRDRIEQRGLQLFGRA